MKKKIAYVAFIIVFVISYNQSNTFALPSYSIYNNLALSSDLNTIDTINYVVLDDAEDGAPSRGYKGEVSNVYDSLRNSRVTFIERGTAYLYKQSYWDPTHDRIQWNIAAKGIGWAIRSKQDFEIIVKIQTENGERYMVYYSSSSDKTDNSPFFYFNLGTSYIDGNWHKFIKDLSSDLNTKEPDNNVKTISYIGIKAQTNAAVDDIRLYPENNNNGEDITSPQIILVGDNNIEIVEGTTYVEKGAFAKDNVTPASEMEVEIDNSDLNISTPGMYRIKYNVKDAAGNQAKTVYRVVNVRSSEKIIGARPVYATPLELGTFFVSPEGGGTQDGSSEENSVSWRDFLLEKWKNIEAGDVVFFRGGTYYFTEDLPGWNLNEGKKNQPVIFESYPGETAIFDGTPVDSLDIHAHSGNVTLYGNYIWLRKVEFNRLPHWGPRVWGAYCIIEGVSSHHNLLSGLEVSAGNNTFNNILRDNYLFENSDIDIKRVGDVYEEYNYGNNADGLTLHSGVMNIVTHNTVDGNSDDGLDSWEGQLTVFSYNMVKHQGKASYKGRGDGGGIKLGSARANGTQVFHNILEEINFMYGGYVVALKNNATHNAVMAYNTLHKSKYSIDYVESSRIYRNIVLRASHGLLNSANMAIPPKANIENSFNMIPAYLYPDYVVSMDEYCTNAESKMLSIDPGSDDYLKPDPEGLFANIGAYADDNSLPDIIPPTVYPYGDPATFIKKGALYIEHGAFAYDAKDGKISVDVIGDVDTDTEATYLINYLATDKAGNEGVFYRYVTVGAGGDTIGEPIPPFVTSVKDIFDTEEVTFEVYPNPSTGVVNLCINNVKSEDMLIRVIDLTGRIVYFNKYRFTGGTFENKLNFRALTNGTYILHGIYGEHSFSQKIILHNH